MIATHITMMQGCTYKGDQTVNPTSTCKSVIIEANALDENDILASNLTHMIKTKSMTFKNTGITSLPDITALGTILKILTLELNAQLTSLPANIMSQMQALQQLFLIKNYKLSQLQDTPMPKLWNLEIENCGFESIPYLPAMGKTITVSLCRYDRNSTKLSPVHSFDRTKCL